MQRFTFKELRPGIENKITTPVKIFTPAGRVKEALPPPPPPPPSFSEAQLKASERDGYQKGFLEGVKEGKKQAENEQAANEKALLAMVEKFSKATTPLMQNYRQLALQVREDMPKVAYAVARKIAGVSLAQNASAVINDIAVRCCESLITEPTITINIHETLGDALEKHLQDAASRLPAATDIIIERNPDIAVTDCRIEWKNGFLERSIEQLLEQLSGVIEDMAATAVREETAQLQKLQKTLQETPNNPEKKE